MKVVRFTSHAEEKFSILANHGCSISKSQVVEAVRAPDAVEDGYKGRRVAQGALDSAHVLRVVFEEYEDEIVIVTFYPGRRSRYEGAI